MKKLLMVFTLALFAQILIAQNVGIGTKEPVSKLQVSGNMMVSEPLVSTISAPTPAQTKTMINGNTVSYMSSDSVMRLYDPGGPAGNYLANLSAFAQLVNPANVIGHEITFEFTDLGTGDSIIIRELFGFGSAVLLAVGNGYTGTGKWIFSPAGSSSNISIDFKSNADANTGAGFSILIKRLYSMPGLLSAVESYVGKSMFFDTKTGSLRSGLVTYDDRGLYSTALGYRSVATGSYSVALGDRAEASGNSSIALGGWAGGDYAVSLGGAATGDRSTASGSSTASGANSTAFGSQNIASGSSSFAIGFLSDATGSGSIAMGQQTLSSGERSVAMGKESVASGDFSTATGLGTSSRGFAGMAIGMYNSPLLFGPQTSATDATPLFIIGNGDNSTTLSNAMLVRKDGRVGIGTDIPTANLHIRHAAGGGLVLENSSDNNSWRIYAAAGDNNLTFYNNANTEIADIDDVTGTFSALSDARYKKDILDISPVLPAVMQLSPKRYHFNWQDNTEQLQLGFLAQDACKLFPELVSYDKEKDLYKMNYAGFSTVAIKAIQEQQKQIEELANQNTELKKRLERLEAIMVKAGNR
jgi:hypothetical protein